MQNSPSRLPPGYKFLPTDEELIGFYLDRKVNGGLPAEFASLFKDYNIYGEEEPWEIFNRFEGHKSGDNGLYFFTTLSKKTVNCTKNKNRKVGKNGGTWHGDGGEEVSTREGAVIGMKNRFRYKNKRQPNHDGWIMLQYGSELISENIVISQLKTKESKKRKLMDLSEIVGVAEDEDIIQISQRFKNLPVINSEPTRSQDQQPHQIIQNQETWLEAATAPVQNMEPELSAIVNRGAKLSQDQELQQIAENVDTWLQAGVDSWEDDAGCATEDSFTNTDPAAQVEPGQVNFTEEPTVTENLETELEAGIVRKEDGVVEDEDIFHDLTDIVSNERAFQVGPDQQLDFIPESTISENQQMALASFNNDHVKETISDKLDDIEMADYLEAIFNGYHISQIIQDLDQLMPSLDDNPAEESGDGA
jgi:hypothetical protein